MLDPRSAEHGIKKLLEGDTDSRIVAGELLHIKTACETLERIAVKGIAGEGIHCPVEAAPLFEHYGDRCMLIAEVITKLYGQQPAAAQDSDTRPALFYTDGFPD